jgi:hypothetical protein
MQGLGDSAEGAGCPTADLVLVLAAGRYTGGGEIPALACSIERLTGFGGIPGAAGRAGPKSAIVFDSWPDDFTAVALTVIAASFGVAVVGPLLSG